MLCDSGNARFKMRRTKVDQPLQFFEFRKMPRHALSLMHVGGEHSERNAGQVTVPRDTQRSSRQASVTAVDPEAEHRDAAQT